MSKKPRQKAIDKLAAEHAIAVENELARLAGMSNQAKRRATILALAEAAIRPDISASDVFKRKGIVSRQTFYSTNKDWSHNALFADVLAKVTLLTQKYHLDKDLAEMTDRQADWREEMGDLAGLAAQKVRAMLDFPLQRVHAADPDSGEPIIIEPANWSFANIAPLLRAVDSVGRMALEMETDRTVTTADVEHSQKPDAPALLPVADIVRALQQADKDRSLDDPTANAAEGEKG